MWCLFKSDCYSWDSNRSWWRNLELNKFKLSFLFGIAEEHNKIEIGIFRGKIQAIQKQLRLRYPSQLCFTQKWEDGSHDFHTTSLARFSALKRCLKMYQRPLGRSPRMLVTNLGLLNILYSWSYETSFSTVAETGGASPNVKFTKVKKTCSARFRASFSTKNSLTAPDTLKKSYVKPCQTQWNTVTFLAVSLGEGS